VVTHPGELVTKRLAERQRLGATGTSAAFKNNQILNLQYQHVIRKILSKYAAVCLFNTIDLLFNKILNVFNLVF